MGEVVFGFGGVVTLESFLKKFQNDEEDPTTKVISKICKTLPKEMNIYYSEESFEEEETKVLFIATKCSCCLTFEKGHIWDGNFSSLVDIQKITSQSDSVKKWFRKNFPGITPNFMMFAME